MEMISLRTSGLGALPALLASFILASPAEASSDDAWAQFSTDVAKACKTAAAGSFTNPRVITDPYGSENYGLAIVTGKLKAGGQSAARASILCVYNKKTHTAEIGSELSEEVLKIGS